jgi:hypothetical protein
LNLIKGFLKNPQTSNFMKIRQVGTEHASRRTDGQTDMTKIAAFRNFAKSSETSLNSVSACKKGEAIPV